MTLKCSVLSSAADPRADKLMACTDCEVLWFHPYFCRAFTGERGRAGVCVCVRVCVSELARACTEVCGMDYASAARVGKARNYSPTL